MSNLSYGTHARLLKCQFYSSPAEWMFLRHFGEWMYWYMDHLGEKNRSSRTSIKSKGKKPKPNKIGEILEIKHRNQMEKKKKKRDLLKAYWRFSCSQINVPLVSEYVIEAYRNFHCECFSPKVVINPKVTQYSQSVFFNYCFLTKFN